MMKSFFKKLAFVMALAMVITTAAPAATAAAAEESPLKIAYQNGMAITEINLMSAGDFEDLKFLGVPNYKELGGAEWSSNNEAVATVDNGGIVTAVAEGTAVVTVTIGDMTASVTVNVGNLPTYTVTIGDETSRSVTEKTLKVGQSVDFAFYGIKDYSRDKIGTLPRYLCTWQSDDTTVLTKDNEAGLFTAVKAGTAKVTLTVANVLTGKTHNVIPVLVTVAADATPTPTPCLVENPINGGNWNATQNTLVLTVGEGNDKALDLADFELYRVFKAEGDKDEDGTIEDKTAVEPYETVYVKAVNYNKKTGIWSLVTFDDFVDGATYEIRYNGRTEQFVASVGDVTKVVVEEIQQAVLECEEAPLEEGYADVTLYDAKDVDVTTRIVDGVQNDDTSNIFFDFTESSNAYALVDFGTYEFYEMAAAQLYATFLSGDIEVKSLPIKVTPEELAVYGVEEILAWTLVEGDNRAKWDAPTTSVPAGEFDYVIATLLKDTRGAYWTTHLGSAGTYYDVDGDGIKDYIGWTENEELSFWKNGLYVEYRAMNPDKMLVENFGEIASYEEGKAYYALYLYNYNQFGNEFVRELDSHYVTVCHPKKLTGMEADPSLTIMMNTEADDSSFGAADEIQEAYFEAFSTTFVKVELLDKLHGTLAKESLADDAEFEIELLTKQNGNDEKDPNYGLLVDLVENEWAAQLAVNNNNSKRDLNGDTKKDAKDNKSFYRTIEITAADFFVNDEYSNDPADSLLCGRTQIKFKITETTTKTSQTVILNLKPLVRTIIKEKLNGVERVVVDSDVALVKELTDNLGTSIYFEKFVLGASTITAKQNVANAYTDATWAANYMIPLYQVDKNGNKIGFESRILVADVFNADDYFEVFTHGTTTRAAVPTDIKAGDRILSVKDPNGKAYPVVGTATGAANAVYNKKEATMEGGAYAMVEKSNKLGIAVIPASQTITSGPATSTDIDVAAYQLVFRAAENGEMVYAKDGRYTVSILTVESVDRMPFVMTKATAANFATGYDADGTTVVATDFGGTAPIVDGKYYIYDGDGYNYTEVTSEPFDYNTYKKGLYYVVKDDAKDVDKDNATNDGIENVHFGKITYATGSGLKYNINVTVDNNNPTVDYKGRDLTRITADKGYLPYYEAKSGVDNDPGVCQNILDAFNFSWGEGSGAGQLSADDILYYTYTVTPTNNQIVINKVVFKVPVTGNNGSTYETGAWYRAYCDVNKSLTYEQ